MKASEMNRPWFALQVRSRYENIVTAHLDGRGFEWFLPQYKTRRRWSDRFKEIEQPLFPGYVFCRMDPLNRMPILTIPGVSLIVGVAKTPIAISDEEIAAIQTAVTSELPRQPWPFMQVGQKGRIKYGPLAGLEGVLVEHRGQHRLVLSVTLLQRSVAVQIDNAWVDPISQSSEQSAQKPNLLHPVTVR